MDTTAAEVAPVIPPTSGMSSMSEMALSPTSVASSGHFPFTASDISGMGVDTCALDTTFTSDVGSSVGLQLGQDGGTGNSRDSLRTLDQIQWNFSLSDLTADLSNLGGKFWTGFSSLIDILMSSSLSWKGATNATSTTSQLYPILVILFG